MKTKFDEKSIAKVLLEFGLLINLIFLINIPNVKAATYYFVNSPSNITYSSPLAAVSFVSTTAFEGDKSFSSSTGSSDTQLSISTSAVAGIFAGMGVVSPYLAAGTIPAESWTIHTHGTESSPAMNVFGHAEIFLMYPNGTKSSVVLVAGDTAIEYTATDTVSDRTADVTQTTVEEAMLLVVEWHLNQQNAKAGTATLDYSGPNYHPSLITTSWAITGDTVAPRVQNNMTNDTDDTIYIGEAINLTAQGYDGGLAWAWLSTNETGAWQNFTDGTYGSPMNMSLTHNQWKWSNFTWTGSTAEKLVSWKIYYNDTSGNENVTDTLNFTVTTAPAPNNPPRWQDNKTSVASGSQYLPGRNYGFEINWTDPDSGDDISNATFETNMTTGGALENITKADIGKYTTFTNTSTGTWQINFTQEQLVGAGNYVFRWYANDTSNNAENSTDQWTYVIAQNPSSDIDLYINDTQANKNVVQYQEVNFTLVLNVPTSGYIELWTNFSGGADQNWTAGTASPSFENITNMSVTGNWSWTANYTNANYTTALETWYVNVSEAEVPQEYSRKISEPMDIKSPLTRQTSQIRIGNQVIDVSHLTTMIKGVQQAVSETLSMQAIINIAKGFLKEASQALDVTTVVTRVAGVYRALSQGLNASAIVTRMSLISRAITQSLDMVNVVSRLISVFKVLSQNLAAVTKVTVSTAKVYDRAASVALGITTTVARAISVIKALIQSVATTASVQRVSALIESIIQPLDVSAIIARAKQFVRTLSQSLSMSAVTTILRGALRVVAQGLTHTAIATRTASALRSITGQLSLTTVAQRMASAIRVLSETLDISSIFTSVFGILRVMAQSVDVSSLSTRLASIVRVLSQGLSVTDIVTRAITMAKFIAQNLSTVAFTRISTANFHDRAASVAMAITDTILRTVSAARVLMQSLAQNAIISRAGSILRTISEQAAFTGIISRFSGVLKAITQSFTITTFSEGVLAFGRTLSQSFSVTAMLTRFGSVTRLFSQSLGWIGMIKRIPSITRILSQVAIFSDRVTSVASTFYERFFTTYFSMTGVVQRGARIVPRIISQALNLNVIRTRLIDITRGVFVAISFIFKLLIPCSIYTSPSSCAAAGCYWWGGVCNEVPLTTTTTTTTTTLGPAVGGHVPSILQPTKADIRYVKAPLLRETTAGRMISVSIGVKNIGDIAYTDLEVKVTGVPGIGAYASPNTIDLGPSESKEFDISIVLPSTVDATDYKVVVELRNSIVEADNFFILRVKSMPPGYNKPIVLRDVIVDRTDGKTYVDLTLTNPFVLFEQVDVVENIPKSMANSTDFVDFETPPTEIVMKDPIVMWRFLDMQVGEEEKISYSIPKILEDLGPYAYWPLRQLNVVLYPPTELESFKLVSFDMPVFRAGKTTSVRFAIQNLDYVPHDFTFTMELPQGWDMHPTLIEQTIEAGETAEFYVQVKVPYGESAGKRMIRSVFGWDDDYIIKEYAAQVKAFALLPMVMDLVIGGWTEIVDYLVFYTIIIKEYAAQVKAFILLPTVVYLVIVALTGIVGYLVFYTIIKPRRRIRYTRKEKLETIVRSISLAEAIKDEQIALKKLKEELEDELRKRKILRKRAYRR